MGTDDKDELIDGASCASASPAFAYCAADDT